MVGFAAAFRPSLNKHEMERLARIHRQAVQKHHAHHETVRHMQDIRRRQAKPNMTTYARPPCTGHWAAPLSSVWPS